MIYNLFYNNETNRDLSVCCNYDNPLLALEFSVYQKQKNNVASRYSFKQKREPHQTRRRFHLFHHSIYRFQELGLYRILTFHSLGPAVLDSVQQVRTSGARLYSAGTVLQTSLNYLLANEVAKGYSNATVRPSFLPSVLP